MITQDELQLNNLSYVSKDFAQVYPEAIEFIKSLTNKWDPETSNESDPGIVLVKFFSFIADKLNYNVDKNTLEHFLPTATQDRSVRMLTESLGYNMRYYVGGITEVLFKYVGGQEAIDSYFADVDGQNPLMTFPAFTTSFKTDDNIIYTLIEDMNVNGRNVLATANAIQGTAHTLSVLGDETIQIRYLDNENRLFFPERMIASNGVFVLDSNNSEIEESEVGWSPVSNLNIIPPKSKVFKFGYDSDRRLPYVQFPTDIKDLIGSGLKVIYITTSGEAGNIKAKALNALNSASPIFSGSDGDAPSFSIDTEGTSTYLIQNTAMITRGENPESIDEGYSNFKRTIGTFETLVTARDYANFIYNHTDDNGRHLVSNVQVTDRRRDIAHTDGVVTYDPVHNVHMKHLEPAEECYNIYIYPLKPITNFTKNDYDNSFDLIEDAMGIKDAVKDSQSICHNIVNYNDESTDDQILFLKNLKKLDCTIYTKQKVNEYQQRNILANVNKAIYENFNSRQVEWGEDIPYDTILKVISEADSNIRLVNLEEPTLTTNAVIRSTSTGGYEEINWKSRPGTTSTKTPFDAILLKNVLEGRIPYLNEDNSFVLRYGTEKIDDINVEYDNLTHIVTSWEPTIRTTETTLGENQVIQLLSPSYRVTNTWSFCYLHLEDADFDNWKDGLLKADTVYTNIGDITIYDSKGNPKSTLASGKAHFRLNTNSNNLDYSDTGFPTVPAGNCRITGNNQLEILEPITEDLSEIDDGDAQLFWILNKRDPDDGNSYLFGKNATSPATRYLLEGEVLVRRISDNAIEIFGPGTKLTSDSINPSTYVIGSDVMSENAGVSNQVSDSSDATATLDSLADEIEWTSFSNCDLKISENEIITLTEGDKIKISNGSVSCDSEFRKINADSITYKLSGEDAVTLANETSSPWMIRSVLDLDCGSAKYQTIHSNESIEVHYISNGAESFKEISGSGSNDIIFNLNYTLSKPGSYINLTIFGNSEEGEDNKYPYKSMQRKTTNEFSTYGLNKIWPLTVSDDFLTNPLSIAVPDGYSFIARSYKKQNGNISVEADCYFNIGDQIFEPIYGNFNTEIAELNIWGDPAYKDIFLPNASSAKDKMISPIYNDEDKEVYLDSLTLYDKNNIANKQTITKIDMDNSNIRIARQSKL